MLAMDAAWGSLQHRALDTICPRTSLVLHDIVPYDIDSNLERNPRGRLPAGSSVTASSRPIHVLVVDDEPALRKVFRTSLAASGFVIEEARSGEEAVDLLPQRP